MTSVRYLNPNDIILADPKYLDQKNDKVRPLLVISKTSFHQNSGFCVCVGITSNKDEDPYGIPYRRRDVVGGRLDCDGHIMCKRLVTLRGDKVLKKIGTQFKDPIYQKVLAKIYTEIIEANPHNDTLR